MFVGFEQIFKFSVISVFKISYYLMKKLLITPQLYISLSIIYYYHLKEKTYRSAVCGENFPRIRNNSHIVNTYQILPFCLLPPILLSHLFPFHSSFHSFQNGGLFSSLKKCNQILGAGSRSLLKQLKHSNCGWNQRCYMHGLLWDGFSCFLTHNMLFAKVLYAYKERLFCKLVEYRHVSPQQPQIKAFLHTPSF